MARPQLGTKRTDPETGRKFYDLGKDPIVSPYTGTSYPLSFFQSPPSAPSRYAAASAKPVHRELGQDDEVESNDEEEETETVSLSEVEDDEADTSSSTDVDGDDDEDSSAEDDTFLPLDEEDDSDNVDDLIGERDEGDD